MLEFNEIEVGGKKYQLDLSTVTLGDIFMLIQPAVTPEQQQAVTVHAFSLLGRALGDQLFSISTLHFGYVLGQIISKSTPSQDTSIMDEIENIVRDEDEKNSGV